MQSKPAASRFRALVEHSADAIWMLAESGAILYANPASRAALGYSPDELAGSNAFDYFLPTDRGEAHERLWGPEEAGTPFRMRRKDGKIVWVDVRGSNRLDDPEVEGVVVSLRDVTESRRAEQALRDSESRFRALVESSSDGFVLLNREGTVVYSGPPVLGYANNAFVGRSMLEAVHPDDLEKVLGDLATVGGTPGKRLRDEFRVRHADGSWRWVDVSVRNLMADPAVGGIVVNYRDITAQRAREEELRRAHDQVRRILESIRESFIALDREWRFTYVNARVAEAIGKRPDEVIGKNIWEEFPAARETEFYPAYRRVMSERVPVQFELYFPPTGRWLDVHAYPTEEGLSAYVLDISLRKRAERRAATLHEVAVTLVESSRLSEIAPRVLRAIRDGLGCAEATFWKVDAERAVLRPWRGKAGRSVAKGEGAAGQSWASGRASWSAVEGKTTWAFPVRQDGETIGVMEFACADGREPDAELLREMDTIAGQIAQALGRGGKQG
jgi:PAS domain S-box-containing protein